MKKTRLSIFLVLFSLSTLKAQKQIRGIVQNTITNTCISDVLVVIEKENKRVKTNSEGVFILKNISKGVHILSIKKEGFLSQKLSITVSDSSIKLGILYLEELFLEEDLSTITLSDDELNGDEAIADNISGLLQSARDTYSRTVAFDWSGSFFKIRGLNSENAKVLINGVEMNKMYNGRPQWNNWGGLNDVLRNQEFSIGLAPSTYTFGGVLGTTHMNTRASEYKRTSRFSYASSNRSYAHRTMGTHASGLLKNGWAYAVSGSMRYGKEGVKEGTSYEAFSVFTSAEKKINEKHSLGFTGIFAPNKRGKASPNTQEVFDLKGINYNEYWGWLHGKKVNSRIKNVVEPILMFHHYWNIDKKIFLNTNVSYQFGSVGNSRLDYTFASNPSPAYYQSLPSFFIEKSEFENAYEAQQNFSNNGQLNWERIYDANLTNNKNNDTAAYILYEDRNDDKQLTVNSIFSSEINENITVNGKVSYRNLETHNYAKVIDELGSTEGYLDFDRYGNTLEAQQNDLQNPNRIVGANDTFKYNYILSSNSINAFAQGQFNYKKIDFFLASEVSRTEYQREGLFENGSYPGNLSFGKSEKIHFLNFGFKTGGTYKITGRHLINFNGGYIHKAPTLRNTFFNAREHNNSIEDVKSEKIISTDVSYILRSSIFQGKLTGYYTNIKDATEVSFFFADGLGGVGQDDNAFVQEILTGIDKTHLGIEFGLEAEITPTFKLKTAFNIGQYVYANNPNLKLTSDAFIATLNLGEANLKNYKLATGPQQAFAFGFEYRDPKYWWVGVTANYLANTYIDIAPLTRTKNFYSDTDGLPFNDYDINTAKKLLQQERFDDYITANVVGGKSWKIGEYYIGLFVGINNVLNTEYKTGGFEQGRNANYRTLRDDSLNDTKIFGSKYWYGRSATYFANLNFSF